MESLSFCWYRVQTQSITLIHKVIILLLNNYTVGIDELKTWYSPAGERDVWQSVMKHVRFTVFNTDLVKV